MTGQQTARKQDVSEFPDPDRRIVQLLDVWKAARNGGLVPNKRNFDPLDVPRLLSSVWLYRFDPEIGDFVCRLAGEDVNRSWGYSIAGHRAVEILGTADHGAVTAIWHSVLATPLIHYGKGERLHQNRMYTAERLVLPLIGEESPGARPDHLLGLSLYGLSGPTDVQPQVLLRNAYQVHCVDIG